MPTVDKLVLSCIYIVILVNIGSLPSCVSFGQLTFLPTVPKTFNTKWNAFGMWISKRNYLKVPGNELSHRKNPNFFVVVVLGRLIEQVVDEDFSIFLVKSSLY